MFHHAFDIPTFVSIEQIEAVYEEGELKVFCPSKTAPRRTGRSISRNYNEDIDAL
jgi:hypothetical protein